MLTNTMTAIRIHDADVPEATAKTGAERQRTYRRKGREALVKRKYRHDNSMHQTNAQYLSRPFRAIDGEGATLPDGRHIYTMLACKLQGAESADIVNAHGLSTAEIFDFLLEQTANDNAINVIYGGSYDFNMWLSDMSREDLECVYRQKSHKWNGYRIAWQRGKTFTLSKFDSLGQRIGKPVTVYDVVSFFQCAFVKACDEYLGEAYEGRDVIIANKAKRSDFANETLEDVRAYNDLELTNLLHLVNELRSRLNKVGLRPKRWDGPGAIAAALLTREGVKKHLTKTPPRVAEAARYAYAGGRFEVIKFGHVRKPAYEYDANSAYPSALRLVPSLTEGEWTHDKRDEYAPFALYHIEYKGNDPLIPGALFRRDKNGSICYPMQVTGWYWTPEYESAKEYCRRGYGGMRVIERWVFIPNVNAPKPFAFIEPLYLKRQALKRAGDGAQVGLKLSLNSLYGKLAQQVGADIVNGEWKIPPFHQLEYAGFTTSYCRAKMLTAAMQDIHGVIAFETDAVFTERPLDVPISETLGEFSCVRFADLTYVQSGLYFGESEKNISKTRGVDRGTLARNEVLEKMPTPMAVDRYAEVSLQRFTDAGIALMQDFSKWRRWEYVTKRLTLEPTGKRIHVACKADKMGKGITLGKWHSTVCPITHGGHSHEFPVLWINPNDEMNALAEMRAEEHDWT